MADCNVCLSLAGGLMRQNLFLEFVRDAIVNHVETFSTQKPEKSMEGKHTVETLWKPILSGLDRFLFGYPFVRKPFSIIGDEYSIRQTKPWIHH